MSFLTKPNDTKINMYKNDAYKAQLVLDSYYRPDKEGIKAYAKYLQNCKENPAAGMLISRNIIDDVNVNFPQTYSRNKHLVLKNPEIQKLVDEIDKEIDEKCFPKTLKAREFLIKTRRVVLEHIMPVKHNLKRELFRIYNAIYQNVKRIK